MQVGEERSNRPTAAAVGKDGAHCDVRSGDPTGHGGDGARGGRGDGCTDSQ